MALSAIMQEELQKWLRCLIKSEKGLTFLMRQAIQQQLLEKALLSVLQLWSVLLFMVLSCTLAIYLVLLSKEKCHSTTL